jgi:hypothetical protein
MASDLRKQLTTAAVTGDVAATKRLLAIGAHADGMDSFTKITPLQLATDNGHVGVMQELLRAGASANHKNFMGTSVLACAAMRNRVPAIKLLAEHKVLLDDVDAGGNTALHLAAKAGHLDAVNALLAAGASKTIRNRHGKTAGDVVSRAGIMQRHGRHTHARARPWCAQVCEDSGADRSSASVLHAVLSPTAAATGTAGTGWRGGASAHGAASGDADMAAFGSMGGWGGGTRGGAGGGSGGGRTDRPRPAPTPAPRAPADTVPPWSTVPAEASTPLTTDAGLAELMAGRQALAAALKAVGAERDAYRAENERLQATVAELTRQVAQLRGVGGTGAPPPAAPGSSRRW